MVRKKSVEFWNSLLRKKSFQTMKYQGNEKKHPTLALSISARHIHNALHGSIPTYCHKYEQEKDHNARIYNFATIIWIEINITKTLSTNCNKTKNHKTFEM